MPLTGIVFRPAAAADVPAVRALELFFEVAGREVRVGAGEVIAVPADAPHRVWTREHPARAVDAWSPVRPEYLR